MELLFFFSFVFGQNAAMALEVTPKKKMEAHALPPPLLVGKEGLWRKLVTCFGTLECYY